MRALALWCCLLAALAGCGGEDSGIDAVKKGNQTNIQRLANLYFSYQSRNDWAGPPNEAALKKFVAEFEPDKLALIGVDPNAVDALFVSERDNQPFKIRYGIRGSMMGSSDPVIFESTGVDGKKQVGFLNMTQKDVDQVEYDQLWAGKGAPSAPTRTN